MLVLQRVLITSMNSNPKTSTDTYTKTISNISNITVTLLMSNCNLEEQNTDKLFFSGDLVSMARILSSGNQVTV